MKLIRNIIPKTNKIVRTLRLMVVLITAVFIISRLQIDYLWFSQFGYQSVLIRKLIFQFIGLCLSTGLAGLCLFWQAKWNKHLKACYDTDNLTRIEGFRYTFWLLSSVIVLTLSLFFFIKIGYIAFANPIELENWTEQIFNTSGFPSNILYISFVIIFISLITKSKFRLLNYLGYVLFCSICTRTWFIWIIAIAIPKTGISEPMLGSDISFSLAQYPAITFISSLVLFLLLFISSNSIVYYLIYSNNLSNWSAPTFSYKSKKYLKSMIGLCLLLTTNLLWLSRFELLWGDGSIVAGADWLDVTWRLPLRSVTSLALLLLSLLLVFNYRWKRKNSARILAIFIVILTTLFEIFIVPFIQWIFVKPREINLQTPYINRSITATRRSFQLDSISTRFINPNPRISEEDVISAAGTLRNIRLWDSQPLLATNRQLQQLRIYYKFPNASVDRYKLQPNRRDRQQIMISARELDHKSLPFPSRTWLNKHFVYTHGYGFTISPVNTKAPDGLPEYFIRDLGKSTKVEGSKTLDINKLDVQNSIPIGRAALYFGTYITPYAIAPTTIKEFDYPEGNKNIYTRYKGKGGIPLSNILTKISAAFYLREPRILLTGVLNKDSKLLIRREVRERVKQIAPFIKIKGDPYLVSIPIKGAYKDYNNNQNQYWIVEGYTSSKTYPYASKIDNGEQIRYIRNSVKAIVDSYSGTVNLYITEPNDPIIQGWKKVFPGLLKDKTKMPPSIKEHLKVPTELFELQVKQLLRYHVTDPRNFYNGDDIWEVPKEIYGQRQIEIQPYHITAQLDETNTSEFLLLQPLSPLARPNLSAWLAARSDGDNYGDLVLLRFPSETSILGPEQIQALINQDPSISQQFSLWDRAGSEVIQGNLLVLPLGKALLYVEPVYIKASQGGLPTLTRVVVSDGKRVAMEETISEGIKRLLSFR